MKKLLIVLLTIAAFFSVMMITEAGMLKSGKTRPAGHSIYKGRHGKVNKVPAATAPTAAAATNRYGTTTPSNADSTNQEVSKKKSW